MGQATVDVDVAVVVERSRPRFASPPARLVPGAVPGSVFLMRRYRTIISVPGREMNRAATEAAPETSENLQGSAL